MRFYYWDAETYDSVDVLNTQNATGTMTMTPMGDGRYKATVGDIAAKELDATVFVAGVYESAGVSYSTGVLSYHLGAYCVDRVNNGGEAMGILAAATAVYGCRAKDYFGGYTAFATAVQKVQNLQTSEESVIDCDGIFVSIGRNPNTELLRGQVELDSQGYVSAGESCRTNIPGVFAVGDVRTKALRQIVTAAADGAVAVHYAVEYLAEA